MSTTQSYNHAPPLTLRVAGPSDRAALRRLAELEGDRILTGPVLLAELDGVAVAALSTAEDRAHADPFLPTAHAVAILRERASWERSRGQRRQAQPSGWRRTGLRVAATSSRRRTGVV